MKYAQDLLLEQIVERATGSLGSLPHHVDNLRFMTPRDAELARLRRFYHDASHLVDVWTRLPRHEPTDAAFVLFHDYVYYMDGAPGENEHASADALASALGGDSGVHVEVAVDGILATARHLEDQPDLDQRIKGWLDADLSGLGSHPSVYRANGENVRQEMLLDSTDPRWVEGRTKFIGAMLARRQIFYLRENAGLEHVARSNMEAELRELRLGR